MIQNSRGVSQHTLNTAHFKHHSQLKIFNVAHVPEALSLECILNLLEYANSTVCIDIRGNHLTSKELDIILTIHPNGLDRIVDLEDYCHMLY